MTTQTTTNTPDEPDEPAAVLEAIPVAALDGQAGAGPIAIFYGAAHYPFELARQRELVEDYADAAGLNLVTEFHDRQERQYGLSMLLAACQRGGIEYVITAGWPTPNLTTAEADAVLEQLAASGTAEQSGETSQPSQHSDGNQPDEMRETGTDNDNDTDNASDGTEPGAIRTSRDASRITETTEPSKEVHHA